MYGIPVHEFVELEAAAQKAYRRGDYNEVAIVNQKLSVIHCGTFLIGEEVYINSYNPKDIIHPEDHHEQ